jgi:hypothetical protein
VRFTYKLLSAGEDIDPDAMDGIDLSKKNKTSDFYITPDADYRLKEFIQSCGIDTQGRSFSELLEDMPGQEVMLTIAHRPNQNNPEEFYEDVRRVVGTAE